MKKTATRVRLCLACLASAIGLESAAEEPTEARKDTTQAHGARVQYTVSPTWRIRSAEQSMAQARKALGLPKENTLLMNTTLVALQHENTPYLNQELIGRPLWHVVLQNWSAEVKSTPSWLKDPYRRTLDIFLDPRTGQIVKIKSRWPEGEPPMADELSAGEAVEEMRRAGNEIYHGFPTTTPRVTFLDALDSMQRESGTCALAARQIVGRYVVWSRMGRKPKTVWAITVRGVPPRKAPPGAPQEPIYQYREIVDAETGNVLCGSNIPHPRYREHREMQGVESSPGN